MMEISFSSETQSVGVAPGLVSGMSAGCGTRTAPAIAASPPLLGAGRASGASQAGSESLTRVTFCRDTCPHFESEVVFSTEGVDSANVLRDERTMNEQPVK